MKIVELIKKVESTLTFEQWRAANKDGYLASIFAIFDPDKLPEEWNVSYYNPKTRKVTVFVADGDVKVNAPSDFFKKGEAVKKIEKDAVKVDFNDALRISKEFQEGSYSAEIPQKIVLVLQKLIVQIWNVSMITKTYKMLNIRINSESGKVIHSSITPLLKFVK